MKFVMLVPEAHGHVNPSLPLATELTARGHEVIYFLPEKFARGVRANGATIRPIDPLIEVPADGARPPFGLRQAAEPSAEQREALSAFMEQTRDNMRVALPALQRQIEDEAADCFIYDAYGFWLLDVARAVCGPKVAFFPTFAIPDGRIALDTLQAAGKQVFPSAMLTPLMSEMVRHFRESFRAEGLNVVMLPRTFQPHPERFDARYLFVGPSIRAEALDDDFPLADLEGRRVALVSLGTAAVDATFFDACFAAFADSDWLVVTATGRTDSATLGPLPENVIARPHVPQLAVLERSSVFVTHGGMNSTMEGLWYGVPLVVVSQHGDQPLVAEQVASLGLGRALDPSELTGEAVREAVEAVIVDQQIAENVARMQVKMRESGGAGRAADAVERFAAGARDAFASVAAVTMDF